MANVTPSQNIAAKNINVFKQPIIAALINHVIL